MSETKLQYKCEKHGIQGGGSLVNITMPDGQIHSLNHCLMCIVELFARNGVCAMRPVVITQEAEAANEFPPMDLGK